MAKFVGDDALILAELVSSLLLSIQPSSDSLSILKIKVVGVAHMGAALVEQKLVVKMN